MKDQSSKKTARRILSECVRKRIHLILSVFPKFPNLIELTPNLLDKLSAEISQNPVDRYQLIQITFGDNFSR